MFLQLYKRSISCSILCSPENWSSWKAPVSHWKHKLDIHGRILSIIAVFSFRHLIMLSELPDIFPADVFRDQLQKSGILHLLYFHIEMLLIIGINMLFRMIKLFFHLLLQLTHDLCKTFIAFKLFADRQIKAFLYSFFLRMYKYDSPQDCNHSNYPEIKAGTVCCSDSDKKYPPQLFLKLCGKILFCKCQKCHIRF